MANSENGNGKKNGSGKARDFEINPQGGTVEILLVEDNPYDAELSIKALKDRRLVNKIQWVKDGAEALEYVFCTGAYADRDPKNLPKLILLDLKLPKINGIEVLQKIKADDRAKVIPVIVLTSSKQEQDVVQSYKLGVNSYIVKPVEFEKFIKSVEEIGLYWLLLNRPVI